MIVGKLAELIVFGLAPLAIGIMALPAPVEAEERVLRGEITYRERIALPPDAVVTVQLTDVSLADAPSTVVATQEIKSAGQVPISFTLSFDSSVIRPQTNYALQARITIDDKIWFLNEERHAVEPLSAGEQKLVLQLTRKSGEGLQK